MSFLRRLSVIIYEIDYSFPSIIPHPTQKIPNLSIFLRLIFKKFLFSVFSLQLQETYKSTLRLKKRSKDTYIFQTFLLKELIQLMMHWIIFDLVLFGEVSFILMHWTASLSS